MWNRQVLASLKGAFTARPDILFVADSKLIADKAVDHLGQEKIPLVSRMPNTYGLTATTKDAAAEHGTWTEQGSIAQRPGAASYRIWCPLNMGSCSLLKDVPKLIAAAVKCSTGL